ncbi:MAG: hypothetical protein IPK39_16420 [Sulfuritalea sp.]|nr:hypothetical protein [Sulfuritalea sp.]
MPFDRSTATHRTVHDDPKPAGADHKRLFHKNDTTAVKPSIFAHAAKSLPKTGVLFRDTKALDTSIHVRAIR